MTLIIAIISEVALDLEIPADAVILDKGVRVYGLLCKLIIVVVDEGGVQSKPANHLALKLTLVE